MSNDYPQTIHYNGETLELLRVTEQPEVMGCPKRIEYGYRMAHRSLTVYMRWDFGNGIDWDLSWANPGESQLKETIAKAEAALAKFPASEKLQHEIPMRPRLQATPPEARGPIDLSAFIRPFQKKATKGNKTK